MENLFGEHSPLPALLVLGGLVAVLSVTGATEPLPRRGYAWRLVVALALVVLLNVLDNSDMWAGWIGRKWLEITTRWITYLVTFASVVALFRWVGRRLVDLRASRWWSLLCLVPLINVAVVVALLFPATRHDRFEDG